MWWTNNLRLKPVMVQISYISSVTVPCSLTSMSSNLSSTFFASFRAPSSLSGLACSDYTEDEDARASHGGPTKTSIERTI
jgi:hypothetical protein